MRQDSKERKRVGRGDGERRDDEWRKKRREASEDEEKGSQSRPPGLWPNRLLQQTTPVLTAHDPWPPQ